MFERWLRYQLANELNSESAQRHRALPLKERRRLFSIGVIDDSPFEPKVNLENLGYKIAMIGDPTTVDVVSQHHIVLCDLQGVGVALNPRKQGAFLIQEIKRHYPEKYVVAYTGGTKNQAVTRDAMLAADEFLKKDVDIDTWVSTLDSFIDRLLNPVAVWQRQREALVARRVDTLSILRLEDAFVRSIRERDGSENSTFGKMTASTSLGADVRAIARSLIASGLFKILTSL